MEAPTLQHIVKFKHQGFTITMKIYAYRKPHDFEIRSLIADFKRTWKKKLRGDLTVDVPTSFGVTDRI